MLFMYYTNMLSNFFNIGPWDYFWFPVLSVYAYFFKSTPFNKAVLCFGATVLATTGLIINYDKLFTEPFNNCIMATMVKSYFTNYILTDLLSICIRGYRFKEPIRNDMIFHHIFFFSLVISCKTSLIQVFVITAEILSIWPLFTNNIKTLTLLRIFSIVPIRFLIWFYCYSIRNFPISELYLSYILSYMPYVTYSLDTYWLYKNIKILYKIQQEEQKQIKNN